LDSDKVLEQNARSPKAFLIVYRAEPLLQPFEIDFREILQG
jgi:hypothetical protein